MDHPYFLNRSSALLEISDYLPHCCENFYCKLSGIAGDKHLGIVLWAEPSRLCRIQSISYEKIYNLLLQTLIKFVLLHIFHPLATGISNQQVGGLRLEIIKIEPANMMHSIVIIVYEVDNIDKPVGYPPVDTP